MKHPRRLLLCRVSLRTCHGARLFCVYPAIMWTSAASLLLPRAVKKGRGKETLVPPRISRPHTLLSSHLLPPPSCSPILHEQSAGGRTRRRHGRREVSCGDADVVRSNRYHRDGRRLLPRRAFHLPLRKGKASLSLSLHSPRREKKIKMSPFIPKPTPSEFLNAAVAEEDQAQGHARRPREDSRR